MSSDMPIRASYHIQFSTLAAIPRPYLQLAVVAEAERLASRVSVYSLIAARGSRAVILSVVGTRAQLILVNLQEKQAFDYDQSTQTFA